MLYSVNKTEQLEEAVKKGYKARASQLRAEGVPTKQHNVGIKKGATKKTTAKKSSARPAAKKSAAKKTPAKKTPAKKS